MPFLTNSDDDINKMLTEIGVDNFEELLKNIPQELRFKTVLNIPEGVSEAEITGHLDSLAQKNKRGISFLGGGVYDHYIPAIIGSLIGRSEFYTAYTPYQPEVSQGTLQSIYEFQSMICELTGMDVTNASMYEGGSALAEAMLLACNHTKKNRVLVAGTLNPRYKKLLETFVNHNDISLIEIPPVNFVTDSDSLKQLVSDKDAAIIVQHPNYFGYLEKIREIREISKQTASLLIAYYDPISLGLLAPPGEYDADIAVAEGQVLGNNQNFGGPFVGLFSTRIELVRKIPGRIAGLTNDIEGNPGFVLTLQTREQHIRREKATSNICTNSGLLALASAIYLAALGKEGIRDVANLCLQKSHYLARELTKIDGINVINHFPFFKEFVFNTPLPAEKVITELEERGIHGGIALTESGYNNHILVAVTEKRIRQEMDKFCTDLKQILSE